MLSSIVYGFLCSSIILLWIYLGTLGFRVWRLKQVSDKTKMVERLCIGLTVRPMKKFFILAGVFGFIYALYKKPIKT
jgi:hypothetical protein